MLLPNAEQAVVDLDKLTEYCLNPDHPRGRHKARVFHSALGITAANTVDLRNRLLEAARTESAHLAGADGFGRRFVVDFQMDGPDGPVTVRSAWIIRSDEEFPRLVSCYVAS